MIFGFLFLILLIGGVLVSRAKSLQISTIEVSGALVTGSAPVEAVTKDMLSGYYLWLIPRANFFLYPRGALEKVLLRKFPRFSSVSIEVKGLQTLQISAIERQPFALYCLPGGALAKSGATGACSFLDESGFIFDTAPTFSEGVYFAYSSALPIEAPLGKEFLPATEFRLLSGFIEKLQELNVKPLSFTLSQDEENLILVGGAVLKWNRESDLSRIFSNLEAFLSSDAIKGQKDFWNKLLVLDLRTENKVFYTFRE